MDKIETASGDNFRGMISLRIPQFGEGIHEVRIVTIHKQSGEVVAEDEILYELETSKSVFAIESEFRGRIIEWAVKADDIVQVGDVAAWIATDASVEGTETRPVVQPEAEVARDEAQLETAGGPLLIPPRVRAYAKRRGLNGSDLRAVTPLGRTMMPADIDRHLQKNTTQRDGPLRELSSRQRMLNQAFALSRDVIVPATVAAIIPFDDLKTCLRAECIRTYGDDAPAFVTPAQIVSFYIAQSVASFEVFRATLVDIDHFTVSDELTLGIAVETLDGDMATAIVENASALGFAEFVERMSAAVDLARNGKDRALQSPQVIVSSLGGDAVIHGVPTLVSPSVAIVAVGAIEVVGLTEPRVTLTMTFDHRLITGMSANRFLQAIVEKFAERCSQVRTAETGALGGERKPQSSSKTTLEAALVDCISRILKVEIRRDMMEEPLGLLGLDSFSEKKVLAFLESYFGSKFPTTFLRKHTTLATVVAACTATFCLSDPEPSAEECQFELDEFIDQIRGELP